MNLDDLKPLRVYKLLKEYAELKQEMRALNQTMDIKATLLSNELVEVFEKHAHRLTENESYES